MEQSQPRTLLAYILPEGEPEGDFVEFYAKLNALAVPVAAVVSYTRNDDLKWAGIHGLLGVPYLVYVLYDVLKERGDEPGSL